MKRVLTTIAILGLCLAPLGADVTITQTITMEGAMAAAMGGQQPQIVTRIKGSKMRQDTEMMGAQAVAITDLDAKQLIILNAADKTGQLIPITPQMLKPEAKPNAPELDIQFKATGNKRTLDIGPCEDHSFAATFDMVQFLPSGQMPPETVEMFKGVKIIANGLSCLAKEGKGVAEFTALQAAAVKSGLMAAVAGTLPGGGGGMEKLMAAATSAPGMPFITEITMTVEGTGPMVEMMKQMGPMKITQKTVSINTDPVSDDLFKVPADYKITEKK